MKQFMILLLLGITLSAGCTDMPGELEDALKNGVEPMRDSFTIDDLDMTFNLIPGGTFQMGSPLDETGRANSEGREIRHWMTITQDYYMQVTEVTQGQWTAVMGVDNNPSNFKLGENYPVESVFPTDIDKFINAVNLRYAGRYQCRLPTEAEWERAARAGSDTAFTNGDITGYIDMTACSPDGNLNNMGWYCNNSENFHEGCYEPGEGEDRPACTGPQPVRGKLPNAYGLYDMHGNVWEWCQDFFAPYPSSPVPDDYAGPDTGESSVLRGGSWYSYARSCRSANRYFYDKEYRSDTYGFRMVCSQVTR